MNNKKIASAIAVLLAALMVLSLVFSVIQVPAYADELDELQSQKNSLSNQVKECQERLTLLKEQQANVLEQKAALDEQNKLANEQLELVAEEIDAYTKLIEEKAEEVEAARTKEERQLALYQARVRAMEESGGFNILSVYHNFKKNPHWGINLGVSWGYRSFNIDGNYALLKENGTSIFTAGNEDTSYNKSRLRHFFFRVPVLMEWQQRVGRNKVFFNAGPEFEIRHSVKSFSHINGGKKKTVGKGMYVQPVGINLLAQAGYGNIGIYLRYSTYGLFQKDKGPEVSPYSFGVAWYL